MPLTVLADYEKLVRLSSPLAEDMKEVIGKLAKSQGFFRMRKKPADIIAAVNYFEF